MRALAFLLALGGTIPTSLYAQNADAPASRPGGPPVGDGLSVSIGVAPVVGPAWQGSKRTAFSIFPDLRINYGDVLFASIPDGIGWNAIREDSWRAGPLVKLGFGRDEDNGGSPFLIAGSGDDLRGLGDIGVTAELGGFVETRFGPQREWQARVEVRRGLGGGHEGVLADVELSYTVRSSDFIVTIGPRATLASEDYMRPFFGINARQSAASGLGVYTPGGGLLSAGVGGTLVRPLGRRSVITVFSGLDYLGAVPGRSPLIRERGERFQAQVGIGYGFRFGL